MTPLSADDLARLRELTEAHQSISPQLATDLLDTVDQLRSLLRKVRDDRLARYETSENVAIRASSPARNECPDCGCEEYASGLSYAEWAEIDAALSAEPASTD